MCFLRVFENLKLFVLISLMLLLGKGLWFVEMMMLSWVDFF